MRKSLGFALLLLGLTLGMAFALNAQESLGPATAQPQFEIAVDTLGIVPMGDSVYVTWVFARESPNHHPVSGLIVGFDCRKGLVARIAQAKYTLQPDGTIGGPIEEMPMLKWVPKSNERMFALVCSIGPTHGTVKDHFRDAEKPTAQPGRDDWRDL